MRLLSRVRARRRTVASVSAVTVFSMAVVAMAVAYDGEATADVDLNDSGVWVTRSAAGQLGRFNTESQALDGVLVVPGTAFDVQQNAGDVMLANAGESSVSPVDVALLKLDQTMPVPADAVVRAGGTAVAILDTEDHRLWVVPFDGLAAFDPEKTEPVAEVQGKAAVAVSTTGTVYVAVPATGSLLTIATSSRGVPGDVETSSLPVAKAAEVDVTVVGDSPVVLDRSAPALVLPGGKTVTPGEGLADAALQQPSGPAPNVAVATPTGLVVQPLKGGDAQIRAAEGIPAEPVQLDGCTFAAWSQSGDVLRDCPGTDLDIDKRLEGIDPQTRLAYRVNRHAIVLNDLSSGTIWMASDTFQMVDDWDQVVPEQSEGKTGEAETTTPEVVDQFVPDRTQPNHPPTPKNDVFGVRPGRTTILPVLANDSDPDGDVITAEPLSTDLPNATVQRILGGAALQAVVPDDAKGRSSFGYRADDGRGGTADAEVTVSVSPWDQNAPPEQTGEPVLVVAQGGTASVKVLPYFLDPDGDDIYLVSATASLPDDVVQFRPDGTIEFRDGGTSTGRKTIDISVSDGMGGTGQGTLSIDVSAAGQLPPIAVGDHVVVPAGQPVTVRPLRNDTDPNGDTLRLASVSDDAPAKITPNYDAGTFTFLSNEPRSYDLSYQVTDGPNTTLGLARVDVVAPDSANGPPVVVTDTALLPAGGATLVDVLANDTDPAGGVLVVQSVRVPEGAGISVAVLAHQMLRVAEVHHLDEPVVVEYTASNGRQTAVGQVRVVPVRAPDRLQPPNAAPDEATVHSGDVVDIPVLRNDTHPDGLALVVQDDLELNFPPGLGEVFVSEGLLRFRAGTEAGTAYIVYRVRDENGQEDSAQVTVHIRDGEENEPPQPGDVEARVLSGASVRIAVPLDGIDPDGDSVQLTGVASQGKKGTAKVVDDAIEYTAADGVSGVDTFTYTVADARGQVATGTVRVGIALPGASNQAPIAVVDHVHVRPGRALAVPVLTNDTDPDGDRIGLVPSGIDDSTGIDPEAAGDRIVVTAPDEPGSYTFYYTIEDEKGARASAAVTLEVAADAPLQRPVARDDVVPFDSILGKTSVRVAVLDNDEDPDGIAADLTVAADASTVTVADDGALTVALTETGQIVTYTATDVDGLEAKAFVRVPGLRDQRPTLRPGLAPIEVVSGEPVTIDITDKVLVMKGRSPQLTGDENVTALQGQRDVKNGTTIVYTSNPDYVGDAAVSFEVTDGSGVDDPDGHTATLTLPITVLPVANLAPVPGTPALDVGAGDEATVDLARFASDLDGDDLTFKVTGTPQGLTTTLEGAVLNVQATPEVPKGTVMDLPITVTDGEHPPVAGVVGVRVVGSTRPPATANPDSVPNAHQGKPVTVDVTANDGNPFPETPLKVVGNPMVETGDGGAVPSGNKVVVTPAEDFVGVMVVRYRIQDATADPDREVDGRIQVTVLGKPEAPTVPKVEEVRSKTVVLSWAPPNNNGAEITGYTVTANTGYSKECRTTTCTVDGLQNNVEYTFTVVAKNAVGPSKPSPASPVARPDEKPDPPAPPTLAFGDRSMTVNWVNQTYTDRSPIECVNLEISPAPAGGGFKQCVSGTRFEWTGLENGTGYRVRVQAVNEAPTPSDPGAWSSAEVPAGKPDAPAKPNVVRTSLGDQAQMRVEWFAPADHGGAITAYTVQALRGGVVVQSATTAGDAQSQLVNVTANTTDYTFQVRAHNKATDAFGDGPFSPQTDPIRAYAAPGAVSGLSAAATGVNNEVQLTFGNASGNGVRAEELSYQYNAGAGWQQLADEKRKVGGLTNGVAVAIQVRAVAGVQGGQTPGPETTANAVTPYGPPRTPGVSGANGGIGSTQATVNWSDPGSNGLGYTVQTRENDGAWANVASSGSRNVGGALDQTIHFCVRTVDAMNQVSPENCVQVVTGSAPAPEYWVTKGGGASVTGCTDTSVCFRLDYHVRNATPNTAFTIECWTTYNGDHQWAGPWSTAAGGGALRTDASGNFDGAMQCVYGVNPGAQVWIRTNTWGDSSRLAW